MLLHHTSQSGVTTLTLNRPDARNALSIPLMTALDQALETLATDQATKVIILAAAGPAFCAGHDLREMRGKETHEDVFALCSRLMQRIIAVPQPVIAKVHGAASAAGCQLVATCDLAIAAESARFATPGVNIGLFCSTPMVALTRAVGRKAAMEMLLTGDLIDARHAVRIGLINRAVPPDQLDAAVAELAEKIASKSSLTVATGKAAFYRQAEMTLAAAYDFASDVMARDMRTHDAAEGIDAFLEKRAPVWSGT